MDPQTITPQSNQAAPAGAIPFGSPPPQNSLPQSSSALPPGAIPFNSPPVAKNPWITNPAAQYTGELMAQAASGIEKHFINVAATPLQGAVAIANKMTGANIPSPVYTGIDGQPIVPSDLSGKGILEKAGDAASIALLGVSPEAQGILRLGALGGAQGIAQSISEGNSPFTLEGRAAIQSDAGKGIVFGGILGLLGNAARVVSGTEKAATGIDPAMETELSRVKPATLSKYIDTAVKSSSDYQAPTVDSVIMSDIQKGANLLDEKVIPEAGKAVGDARKAAANIPIMSVQSNAAPVAGANVVDILKDQINEKIQAITGHQFSTYSDGIDHGLSIENYPEGAPTTGLTATEDEHSVVPLAGRPAAQLEPSESKSLGWLSKQLEILKDSPTVQTASDIITQLDKKIDWARIREYGAKSSPVDSILQQARGMINGVIRPAAPDLAAANDVYGPLAQAKQALVDAAGKDLDHLDLLTRRVIYSGQSENAQSVLDTLQQAVTPYLPPGEESYTTKAIVARFARDAFSGKIGQTGFAQGMSSGDAGALASGYRGRLVSAALRAGKRALAPDTAQYAMSISKGEPYSFIPLMHKIDEFVDSPSSNALTQSFKNGLSQLGVSSSNAGIAAKAMLRIMMVQQITRPNQLSNPQPNPTAPQAQFNPQSSAPTAPVQSSKSLSLAPKAANQAVKSLTPASSGQAMASQARKGGLSTMSNGMNLGSPGMNV